MIIRLLAILLSLQVITGQAVALEPKDLFDFQQMNELVITDQAHRDGSLLYYIETINPYVQSEKQTFPFTQHHVDEVVKRYSEHWQLNKMIAVKQIELMIASVKISFELRDREIRSLNEFCGENKFKHFRENLKKIDDIDKSGDVLLSILKNLLYDVRDTDCLIGIATDSSNAGYIMTKLAKTDDIRFAIPMMLKGTIPKGLLQQEFEYSWFGYKQNPFEKMALLKQFLNEPTLLPPDQLIELKRLYIIMSAQFLNYNEAYSIFKNLSDAELEKVIKFPLEYIIDDGVENSYWSHEQVASILLSLMIYYDDMNEARDFIGKYDVYPILKEITQPTLTPAQLYDHIIYGENFEDYMKKKPSLEGRHLGTPWIDFITAIVYIDAPSASVVKHVVRDYLLVNGNPSLAERITRKFDRIYQTDSGYFDYYNDILGSEFYRNVAKFRSNYETTLAKIFGKDEHITLDYSYLELETRPVSYDVNDIPDEYKIQSDEDAKILAASNTKTIRKINQIALPEYVSDIIRAEWIGDNITIILDEGYIGDAGGGYYVQEYYVVRSSDGGKSWSNKVSLGLTGRYPYYIINNSKLPMWDGIHLNLEVEVYTDKWDHVGKFPIKDNTYISAAWDDLIRDQDGDGLTDVFEHRIGLSYLKSDTDGDQINDDIDPLPHVKYKKKSLSDQLVTDFLFSSDNPIQSILNQEPQLKMLNGGKSKIGIVPDFTTVYTMPRLIRSYLPPTRMIAVASHALINRLYEYGEIPRYETIDIVTSPLGDRFYINYSSINSNRQDFTVYKKDDGNYRIINHNRLIAFVM